MTYRNLDKALLYLRNQLSYSSIYFAETSHTFSTYNCLNNGVWDFFLLYLDFELFAKIEKDLVSTHPFLLISQDLKKEKNSTYPFVDTTK